MPASELKAGEQTCLTEIPPPFGSAETKILRWGSKSKSYLERSKSYDVWQDTLDLNAGHFPACFHALEGISETLADVTIKHIDSGILIDADSTQSYPTSDNRIKPDWRFRDAVGICSGGASPCKVRDPPG